jgi:hypothetical protein
MVCSAFCFSDLLPYLGWGISNTELKPYPLYLADESFISFVRFFGAPGKININQEGAKTWEKLISSAV